MTMLNYLARRMLIMIPTLFVTSVLIFVVMKLPPTDYFETYVAELQAQGERADLGRIEYLKKEYGLDQPPVTQYIRWVTGFFRGDFGYSFQYDLPVSEVVGERLGLTILVSFLTIILTWIIAFPIGIYSATHQYSWGDYGLSFLGLLGIAIPHFLLALVMMYFANLWFGLSIGGLMDAKYFNQPMSWEKAQSILAHIWIPVLIIGAGGTGSMIRKIRANLLDELQKQYYVTAKAKGLPPNKALMKYPFRMSLNFFISHIGDILPTIVSGAELTAVVLSLQTTGPLLLNALQSQDMFLAGSFLMFLALMTVIGVLISDIALALLDPRIRLQGGATR
ncbi:DppB ABC-type dipeptide/oligopeptide/nickel transport systems, permease components [Rhabdaerophilaceae bacterium]